MDRRLAQIFWLNLSLVEFACGNGGIAESDTRTEIGETAGEVAEDEMSDSQLDTVFDVFEDVGVDFAVEDSAFVDGTDDFNEISGDIEVVDREDGTEAADADDVDERSDAFGEADVTCECELGAVVSCITFCGTSGVQRCDSSCVWGPCRADEVCNNCDDDADTHIDDGVSRDCTRSDCPVARQTCIMGSWTACVCID